MQMWVVNGREANRNETKANCKCGATLATAHSGIANLLAALRLQFMRCLPGSRTEAPSNIEIPVQTSGPTEHRLANPFA